MLGGRKSAKDEKTAAFLAKGVILNRDGVCQEEKRRYTLLLKGLLVYLVVMGSMGCFLSALDTEYSVIVLNAVILIFSLFCSMLYYSKRWERAGYLVVLLLVIVCGNEFGNYINSGFYAIANDISKRAAVFFDTSAMRNYGEQVGNRYAAVTISMCFIGSVCCVIANIMISRRMAYKKAALISVLLMLTPLYLELEPNGIYAVMLLSGLVSVYIINRGGHYELRQNDSLYEIKLKEQKISYVYAARTAAGIIGGVLIISIILTVIAAVIYPKAQFKSARTMSALKKSTMDTMENLSILGMMGLFNFYPNTGGLTSGTLGGVSSVRLDLETDLTVEFAPYDDERIYLKTFMGASYLPYSNRWSRAGDINNQPVDGADEAAALLKRRYEDGMEYSARGVMKITNVAAAVGVYLPYYSEDIDKLVYPGQTQEYTYYPRVYAAAVNEEDASEKSFYNDSMYASESYNNSVYENEEYNIKMYGEDLSQWLYVPRENIEVIAAFVKEAGFSYTYNETAAFPAMDTETAVRELAAYYQENIPYTLRPGMTPYKKDFVNYFLAENKRGYCAHFASAATLIFRYLGIPARYVEGYAIDPSDIAGRGELLADKDYGEYYDGYSPLQTDAVVSVDATDANAHAWVEVYDSSLGWVVAEVTPVSYEEEPGESLWQRLMNFLTGDSGTKEDDDETADEAEETGLDEQSRRLYMRALEGIAAFIVLVLLLRPLIKKIRGLYIYHNSNRSGRLIIRYQNYIEKIARKNSELTKMVNYSEQLRWLAYKGFCKADGKKVAECVGILEKAGFSDVEISEEEFEEVVGVIFLKGLT